jgi:hypothetical protein
MVDQAHQLQGQTKVYLSITQVVKPSEHQFGLLFTPSVTGSLLVGRRCVVMVGWP